MEVIIFEPPHNPFALSQLSSQYSWNLVNGRSISNSINSSEESHCWGQIRQLQQNWRQNEHVIFFPFSRVLCPFLGDISSVPFPFLNNINYNRKVIYNKSNSKIKFTKDNKHKMIFAKKHPELQNESYREQQQYNKMSVTKDKLPFIVPFFLSHLHHRPGLAKWVQVVQDVAVAFLQSTVCNL